MMFPGNRISATQMWLSEKLSSPLLPRKMPRGLWKARTSPGLSSSLLHASLLSEGSRSLYSENRSRCYIIAALFPPILQPVLALELWPQPWTVQLIQSYFFLSLYLFLSGYIFSGTSGCVRFSFHYICLGLIFLGRKRKHHKVYSSLWSFWYRTIWSLNTANS